MTLLLIQFEYDFVNYSKALWTFLWKWYENIIFMGFQILTATRKMKIDQFGPKSHQKKLYLIGYRSLLVEFQKYLVLRDK